MRHGRRLGVDVGKARVGLAQSDPHGMLATPVETVPRGADTVATILARARELDAIEIVVGLPISLSGAETASTQDARDVAQQLAREGAGIPVRLVDERMSTVTAQAAMRASGRSSKRSRSVIDQAAAVVILQHALDAESASSIAPGALVSPE